MKNYKEISYYVEVGDEYCCSDETEDCEENLFKEREFRLCILLVVCSLIYVVTYLITGCDLEEMAKDVTSVAANTTNQEFVVMTKEQNPSFHVHDYYLDDKYVGSSFAYADIVPQTYWVDVDKDGINEFIAECTYADGSKRVLVYKEIDGVLEKGRLQYDVDGIPGLVSERYDENSNTIVLISDEGESHVSLSELVYVPMDI